VTEAAASSKWLLQMLKHLRLMKSPNTTTKLIAGLLSMERSLSLSSLSFYSLHFTFYD